VNARRWRLVPILGTAAVFWLIHGELLFAPTTPASYDLTGHLVPVNELITRMLGQGRVHGWSEQWFSGLLLFYFYFPLPALIVAALTPLLGVLASFKLTAALGVLAFPTATYVLYRALPVTRAQAAAGSLVAATFLLMQSFLFLGGNIASTLAGEYAYSLSFTLALLYVAAVLRAKEGLQAAVFPGLVLACVALSHTVPTLIVVLATMPLLFDSARRRTVIGSWILGFLLSGFWSVPFLLRSGNMAAVFIDAVRSWREALPLELWPLLPLAAIGACTIRHDRRIWPLLSLTAAGLLGFLVAGRLVYPGRFLPFWFIGVHLLAGYAVCWYMAATRDSAWPSRTGRSILAAVAVVVIALNVVRGTGSLRHWAGVTFAGLERTPTWRDVQSVMRHLSGGEGRVYWEQAPRELAALGSRNLPAATPWFASGRAVVNGLWHESAQLGGVLHDIDAQVDIVSQGNAQDAGSILNDALARLRALGVTQIVALRPHTARALARTPGVTLELGTPRLAVFRIPAEPLVVSDSAGATVRILEWSAERIRFQTDRPGVPHTVRMSWFPNWKASGAAEPERMPTSFMRITPSSQNVELVFERTWVEHVAAAATAVGAVLSLLLIFWRRPYPLQHDD